ncbi:hypothetical protein BJF93_08970 [Xaviernesmea oryzae]|uniref:Uncharacterized protein n=1 Tax=Xaviernesmea oryzae TaxID=464029 RepID=A0A1Q9AXJ6_9HYPH|nr:hypothetical protein [Xaviernesmea oryzae]OLP60151.1 hypothetical protein BJF93_08970 [Xaviernesmea oryzae]SEM40555.1 hypothetical protein SAMN04487976_1461 [Xaviernesmea oryzae]
MTFQANTKAGICFIFNHPFPHQITVLRRLYKDRFTKILFLVPFHLDSSDDDVVTVYSGAFNFDSIVVQAKREIKAKFADCSHVLFVHNDLLLSGRFDEGSVETLLGLKNEQAYISEIRKISGPVYQWVWLTRLCYKFKFPMDSLFGTGSEKARQYLPSIESINQKCLVGGFDPSPSYLTRDLERIDGMYAGRFIDEQLFAGGNHLDEHGRFMFSHPLFSGYSDIFCVPYKALDEWLHVLGTLSAMDIFPEISIPTSLVWVFGRVSTAEKLGLRTSILWQDRYLADKISWVIERLEAGEAYIHPVKYEQYSEEEYGQLMLNLDRSSAH